MKLHNPFTNPPTLGLVVSIVLLLTSAGGVWVYIFSIYPVVTASVTISAALFRIIYSALTGK